MTDADAAAAAPSGDEPSADEPPPPVAYTEPVAGPVGRLFVRGTVKVLVCIGGVLAGIGIHLTAARLGTAVTGVVGGAATRPATVCVALAPLVWAGLRRIARIRGDGPWDATKRLGLWSFMYAVMGGLIGTLFQVVYALAR